MTIFKTKLQQWREVLPAVIGMMAFMIIIGPSVLDGSNISWLMAGDPTTYWIGWHFFRDTPFWQWPLGKNWAYGMELSSSIVYSDSNTLMAFLFKPFSDWLPERFQYLGLWIFICFILQSFFAWKLLSRFIDDKRMVAIACLFFLIAPPWLFRISGHLSTLASHWLILAGLTLYFSTPFYQKRWIALMALCSCINYQLFILLFVTLIADAFQKNQLKKTDWKQTVITILCATGIAIFIMWVSGAFMIPDRFNYAQAYGRYRLNLWAPFNPMSDSWSMLIPSVAAVPAIEIIPNYPLFEMFEYEGFNFLGSGVIVLLMVSIGFFIYLRLNKKTPLHSKKNTGNAYRWLPIVTASGVCTLYAITHLIAFGPFELLHIPIPQTLQNMGDAVRGSGRFFWLSLYLIYLAIFVYIWKNLPKKTALFLCASMLILQTIDSHKALQNVHRFYHPPEWKSPMKSPQWDEMARYYKNIRVVPSFPDFIFDSNWVAYLDLAARNHRPINSGYFSRYHSKAWVAQQQELSQSLKTYNFSDDSLYLISGKYQKQIWEYLKKSPREDDELGEMDGFYYLAPRYKTKKQAPPTT